MRLFVLLVCCAAFLTGAEPSALERSQAAAQAAQTVRIAFTQTKELAILDQPLVTSGSLEIDRAGSRLRWQFDHGAVLVLAGPTASGKTALSLALAHALDGEIISADSVQASPS
jgi:ATP-dependent Clp protease ATP-binding subunit ClpA